MNLKRTVEEKQDNPTLFANIAGKELDAIVPYDLHYHRTCFYTYVKKRPLIETQSNEAFLALIKFVEDKIFVKCETVTPAELLHFYNGKADNKSTIASRSRPVLEEIQKVFGERLSLYKPISGTSFLFNNQLSKGEIFGHFNQKLKELESQIENKNKHKDDHDCIDIAADKLRNEIKNAPKTYDIWPPSSQQLHDQRTLLQPHTERFLVRLLNQRKDRLSKKKRIIVSSIGQDIIYNVSNGDNRTSKHTLLALCTKRRTGSKKLLTWLNRFGHTLSYDETLFVETTLAEDEARNQNSLDYYPNIIQFQRSVIMLLFLYISIS